MGFPVTEVSGQLAVAGSVTLDSVGNGVLTFDPASGRERWEVASIVVSTNQAAAATLVPVATVAKNTLTVSQLSQANNRGQSWSGNQDTFSGQIDIGPADFLSVLFNPPPGAPILAAQASGSVTTPTTFDPLVTVTAPVAGSYLIQWSVALGGTVAAAELNNFQLTVQGASARLAQSVNAAAVGTYPQADVTATLKAGDILEIQSNANTPTTGAVYTGTLTPKSPLSGVLCYATVTGTRYVRRA